VFSGAIGLFALGSLLCGLALNIHLLVAFRVLQGCGGAMMVPVGRLTLVRSFAKSQLVRAMTFVAIPSLVGPMLGPIAGGVITGYLHWSVIFFLNVPIGIVGLYLVYRHLPDYRETRTSPLDVLGLVLFSSGIALLSYVLEVFGEHRLGTAAILELLVLAALLLSGYGLNAVRTRYPLLRLDLFRIRTFRAAVSGSFFTRISIAGVPFLLPLLYQVGLGYSPIQSGLLLAPQAMAAMSLKLTMPRLLAPHRAGVQHRGAGRADHAVRHHRPRHSGVAHRRAGLCLRIPSVAAVHEHEHAGVCGRERPGSERREHHRQHRAATVHELRGRHRLSSRGAVHTRSLPHRCAARVLAPTCVS
jgi:hypothetical protein